jgi:hypothetical protein
VVQVCGVAERSAQWPLRNHDIEELRIERS